MDNAGMLFYERGRRYFELGRYDEAVSDWIQAYGLDYEKEVILEDIYNCFVLPNEQDFRENYEQGRQGFTQLPFEESVLDFIPVSQDKFYIFDRVEEKFQGEITLAAEPVHGKKVEFCDILYANTWDIRELLLDMEENSRDTVYVVLNDLETKFVSFFKLPRFKELYLRNVMIFKDEGVMCSFFEEHEEYYLPKQLVCIDTKKYWNYIDRLHKKRLQHLGKERKNIFLSICIPSYNRGKLALENVQHILSCPYDSEIEVIVSNNGSTKEAEFYDAIKNMEDSRVQYYEFDENQGYAANILKVCEMAKGKYAVLVSDEDWMILENLGEYLNFIKMNLNCGVFYSNVKGKESYEKNYFINAGMGAISFVSTKSYLTGITYNMGLCYKLKVIESLKKLKCKYAVDWRDEKVMSNKDIERNLFFEILTHECISTILSYYADVAVARIILWDSERKDLKIDVGFTIYYKPETRIEILNSFLDFCSQTLSLGKQEFVFVFLEKCQRIHFLIHLSFLVFIEDMLKFGSEWEVQAWIYQEQVKYLNAFPFSLTKEEYKQIEKIISKIKSGDF